MTGSQRPTLQTVAREAGVSSATASYVLRGIERGASAETAARVRAVAERLGYRVNTAARAVRTGRTGVVLLSLHRAFDPWAVALTDAVKRAARETGRSTIVLPGEARGEDWYDSVAELRPDVAFIEVLDDLPQTRASARELTAAGQRIVVHHELMPSEGYDVIRPRPEPGAAQIVAHLAEQTDDIAFLTTEPHSLADNSRARPYLAAVSSGVIRPRAVTVYDGSRADAFRQAVGLLQSDGAPRAVMCHTDDAALQVIQAAYFLGKRVPDDVLIAGMDNTQDGQESTPSLTSAGPDDAFTREAQLIIAAADRPPGTGRVHEFDWSLRARASTSIPDRAAHARVHGESE